MTQKRTVNLLIISNQDGQKIVQELMGEQYLKEGHFFVRCQEVDPAMGRTAMIVKVEANQLRITRQGDVESQQTFVQDSGRIAGYYRLEQGQLALETLTHSLSMVLDEGLGTISWTYDLFVGGEFSGSHQLSMTIDEA